MLIIWGSKLYGKVDTVPGLCHVATKFGHLWYIPLIPLETYVVLSQNGDNWQGLRIPMNGKSVFMAWLRAATLVGGVGLSIVGAMGMGKGEMPDSAVMLGLGLVCLAISLLTSYHRKFVHANYSRACQIGELLGLNDEGRRMLDAIYIPDADSERHDPFADLSDEGAPAA